MRVANGPRAARAAALLWIPVFLACQSDEEKTTAFMSQGDAYIEESQFNEAIIEYRNALKLDPNNATAHYSLAKAYLSSEKAKEAYWEFSEAVRLDGSNLDARLSYGQLSLVARNFEESLSQAEAIVATEASNGGAHLLRGQALEGLDRMEEAEEAFLEAREVDPDESTYLLTLAGFYSRRGDREAAEPLLVAYAEAEPGYLSHTAMARFLIGDRSRDADTEISFRSAIELVEEPRTSRAYQNLAGFLFSRSRFDDAVATLESGIRESEEKLELIYLLARFYRTQGAEAKADALIVEATRADPDNPGPHLLVSLYRGRKGDLEGALDAAEQALLVDPEHKEAKLRKAELLVDIGARDRDSEKIEEGREAVEALLEAEPSSAAALFVRAKLELAGGNAPAAVVSLRSCIDVRPDWAQAHFVLGSVLASQGDQSGARAELGRAVEIDGGMLEARRQLARVHAALGEHEYAIEQGRIALRAVPDHIPTRLLVAQSLVRLGKPHEASAELGEVPIEKQDAEVMFALGRLHLVKGELKEAREYLLKADEQRPHDPQILRGLLRTERQLGLLGESEERIAAAVEAKPKSAKLMELRGGAALLAGDLETAEQSYRVATELDPNDLQAYQQLAGFYRFTGRVEETISTYEKALEARPDSAQVHHFLAVLYEFSGDPDKSVGHYEKAIELDANMGESKNNLAYLLADRGESLDRALDLAQEAKALLPDNPNSADTLGWVLYKRGIPSAAVGYLREAEAGMDPNDANLGVVRHHLALAYEANEENDKAIESLERALSDLKQQLEAVRANGGTAEDPAWAVQVRDLLKRLQDSEAS